MTDQTDSTPLEQTPKGQPPQGSSSTETVQPGSEIKDLAGMLDALTKKVTQLESAVRSEKDRAVNRTDKRVTALEEQLRPLLEQAATQISKGKTVEDAIASVTRESDEARVRATMLKLADMLDSGQLNLGTAGGLPPAPDAKVLEVVGKYGMEKDDVDANLLINRWGSDPERLEGELAKLVLQRQKSSPTPATRPPTQGTPPKAVDEAATRAAYEKEVAELKKNNLLNPTSLANLKQKYRRDHGLTIW